MKFRVYAAGFIEKGSLILLCSFLLGTVAEASPAACMRNTVAMFNVADAVVEAVLTSSKRWREGQTTNHLVAQYQVNGVFKGDFENEQAIIVTDTCLDQPIPDNEQGYPGVQDYCLGVMNLSLSGVNARDGRPNLKEDERPALILFLKHDVWHGATHQTWLEVSRTGYTYGEFCQKNKNELPAADQLQYEKLLELHPDLR
ncbi:MAG: hypothetical protein ACPGYT_08075 [Nitrospirales bacterium]